MRGGARRPRGPGSVNGRAVVRGASPHLPFFFARLERVEGGSKPAPTSEAFPAALGRTHGEERPPPRPREGTRRRSWPRRRWLSIREEVGTSRSSPPRARPVPREGGGRLLIAPQRPLPTHCLAVPAFQQQLTRFAAGTATFNREKRRISREEVGTSCSSPLARALVAGRRRSTSRRASSAPKNPTHC